MPVSDVFGGCSVGKLRAMRKQKKKNNALTLDAAAAWPIE
jgi:hypothetical protein